IIPLLLDFESARDAVPSMALPEHGSYGGGAERAAWHVAEGNRVFTRAFGVRPTGCWPSEGAISRGTLELLDRAGFSWIASSTNVLRGSLERADRRLAQDPLAYNRPYRLPGAAVNCFFRDDNLSDLIGFTYATWHGDDAAQNLVTELAQLAASYAGAPNHAVLIALDGENAWEHYPFNGYYFLRALYALLAAHPLLELTTLSDCLARGIEPAPLQRVVAGSWVHGTLATWMGDPAKNRAWDLLCEAKEAFDRVMQAGAPAAPRKRELTRGAPCDCPYSIGAARVCCCIWARSRPPSVVAAGLSSTGSPPQALPCGRSCPWARRARTARLTGCVRTLPATRSTS